MLGSKGYQRSYSNAAYKKAVDYEDLLTAFANDVERAQEQYDQFRLRKRNRTFSSEDSGEESRHAAATAFERQLDVAAEQLAFFLPEPNESKIVEKIYNSNRRKWNNTAANRFEIKIINAKKIIKQFQEENGLYLRQSYYYENSKIYVGNGKFVSLATGSLHDNLAMLLFQNIHKSWEELDMFDEITELQGLSRQTEEADIIAETSMKRLAQTINDKISEKVGKKTRLVIYAKPIVKLDVSMFNIFDRLVDLEPY